MALTVGSRLRNFEILAAIGAGGMGEVYRARDLKLRRDVAVKILPESFASDAERLERFQREAQAIAALNHPNVVTIHSVQEVDDVHFLTMELIEGKTIAEVIPSGGLPARELLRLALPLAHALSAAHARGIIHRDLKPSNVMVAADGRVKVLDFGLAKVKQVLQGVSEAGIPTTENLTVARQVAGTPAYMSPEQAEGGRIDPRSDVFSLGVMLYEMATGTRPFRGSSAISILSSILKDAPTPVAELRPDLPADLDRIVRRCLAKDPARRYQTAIDVRNELEDVERQLTSDAVTAPQPRAARRPLLIPAIGVTAAIAIAGVIIAVKLWPLFTRASSNPALRATFTRLTSQPGAEFFPSLSPDGKWVVYSGEATGNRDIYLQSVGGETAINLTGDSPEDDEQPAFSPDGERIVFRSGRDGGGIFVMGRTGEAVRRVTREGFNPAWSKDGAQLAYTRVRTEIRPQNAEERSELKIVSVKGGEPRVLHARDSMLPSWSPNGAYVAFSGRFMVGQKKSGVADIFTISAAGGEPIPVTQDEFIDWNPVWSADGRHLYFVSDRGGSPNIWRIPMDPASGRPRGDAEPLSSPASFAAHVSLAADGTRLVYSSVLESQNIQKLRLDPATGAAIGEPMPVTSGSRFWSSPDPSPDGEWVVFYSQVHPEGDLYVARADGSGAIRQLTTDAAIDRVPRWSPDGQWIAMFSDRTGSLEIWKVRVDGSDLQQVTREGGGVTAWSPDGTRLAVTRGTGTRAEAWVNPIVQPHRAWDDQPRVFLPRPPPPYPQFVPNSWSSDGRWIAGQNGYTVLGVSLYSTETKQYQRLTDFGEWPVWLPDRRRILFVARRREFHVVDIHTKATRQIFSVKRDILGPPRVTRDGRAAFFSRRNTESDIWLATLQ